MTKSWRYIIFQFSHDSACIHRTRDVYVCVQGHCREFKVIEYDGQHHGLFSIERENALALVLNTRFIGRNSTLSFFVFDVIANCSMSPTNNSRSTVIRTQVLPCFVYIINCSSYYTLWTDITIFLKIAVVFKAQTACTTTCVVRVSNSRRVQSNRNKLNQTETKNKLPIDFSSYHFIFVFLNAP